MPLPARATPIATPRRAIACVAAAFVCAGASGQFALNAQPPRVDQGYADIDALSSSLRAMDMPALLRHPAGFQDLFRGPDGTLYRFDGGVAASFPYSDYIQTKDGEQTLIPAGTEFFIGMRPEDLVRPPAPAHHSPARASLRAPLMMSEGAPPHTHSQPLVQSTIEDVTAQHIVTDERYRRERIAELLRESAADDASMGRKR